MKSAVLAVTVILSLAIAACSSGASDAADSGATQVSPGMATMQAADSDAAAGDASTTGTAEAPAIGEEAPGESATDAALLCAETAGWGTAAIEAPISLNASITGVVAEPGNCFDTISITLSPNAGVPGYSVQYVDEVAAQGTGDAVPLAGSHALSVVIDSSAYDLATGAATVELGDAMVDVGALTWVRQVASGGSFEGMTTFGIGLGGERPFTVDAEPGRLSIRIAHAGTDAADGSPASADPAVVDPAVVDAASCDALRELSVRVGRYADRALLPVTADEIRADFNAFEPHSAAFPEKLIRQVRIVRMAAMAAADRDAASAADILDDVEVRTAGDYVTQLYWEACHS